jgi:hypothetical protein
MDLLTRLYTQLAITSNYIAIVNLYTLQIITALAKLFPASCVLNSHFLATAPNSENSSVSRAQVLLSQPPVQNSCQLNCSAISSQPPLQSSNELVAEHSRAVACCRQPASMVTLGIEPRWDPWPYICSASRLLFFSSFVVPPLTKREGLDFFIIGVPLLHLIPPEVTIK